MTLEAKVLALRLFVVRRAAELENVTEACHQLGISRTLFYGWRARSPALWNGWSEAATTVTHPAGAWPTASNCQHAPRMA